MLPYTLGANCDRCGPNTMCQNDVCVSSCTTPVTSACCSVDADVEACSEISACVCNFDPYCCEANWDSQCVFEAETECNLNCELSGLADTYTAFDSQQKTFACKVDSPVALATGLIGVALGIISGGTAWIVAATAAASTVGTAAGSMTCGDSTNPQQQLSTVEQAIRAVEKLQYESAYKQVNRVFQRLHGQGDKLYLADYKTLMSIMDWGYDAFPFLEMGGYVRSALLNGQLHAALAPVGALRITKAQSGSQCDDSVSTYLQYLDIGISHIEEAKTRFELYGVKYNAQIICDDPDDPAQTCGAWNGCSSMPWGDWEAKAQCVSLGLSPRMLYIERSCTQRTECALWGCAPCNVPGYMCQCVPMCQKSRCHTDERRHLEGIARSKINADWNRMFAEWWNGKGTSGQDGYIEGVQTYHEKLVGLRDEKTREELTALCGTAPM